MWYNSCTYNLRQGDPYYRDIANRAFRLLKEPSVPVMKADSNNACAVDTSRGTMITYDPDMFSELEDINSNFPIVVINHEVGHISMCHVGCKEINDRGKRGELEADHVAGWLTRKMDIGLYESVSLYDHPWFKFGGDNHPDGALRKQAFTKGWKKADDQIRRKKQKRRELLAAGGTVLSIVGLLFLVFRK